MAKPFEYHVAVALGLDPDQIQIESLNIQFLGTAAQITWGGIVMMDSPEFQAAINQARQTFEKELADG